MGKGNTQIRNISKSMKTRVALLLGFCVLFFGLLVVVLFKLQLLDYDKYKTLAESQQLRDTTITANRGTIYDSDMNILAQSITAWTVTLSPIDMKEEQHEAVAEKLSEVLGVSYDTVLAKCKENNYYSIVKRKVEQDVVDEIRAWATENSIRGINFTEDSKRYYPYGNFLSTVLGFVGTDNTGLEGLEAYYNSTLSGTSGRILTAKNAAGGDIYYQYETYYEATPGYSLVLTIDEVVQYYLEKYVEEAMVLNKVENYACGIVMDVNTGAIVAMTTKPDYDPNSPLSVFDEETAAYLESIKGTDSYNDELAAAQMAQWANKAIQYLYEPGSVFKVVTASAALEAGVVTTESTFYCPSSITIAGQTYHCASNRAHGSEDFTDAVVNSCNVAFITIGQKLGIETFCDFFEAFGLTEKTGIDLPGEATSIYHLPSRMGIIELASSSFGQSQSMTPIQIITAVAAAVNGGYLVEPYIVDKVLDEDGNIVSVTEPNIKRQIISAETSEIVALAMEQVVKRSAAKNAYTVGYRVGGKTGTSEKLAGAADERVASFCGIAPVDNPQYALLVMFDTPRGIYVSGSIVAAPCAGKIWRSILPHLGINPVYTGTELEVADKAVISVLGSSVSQARSKLSAAGFDAVVVGSGSTVLAQFPSTGMSIPNGSTVYLYTEEGSQKTATVPNLTGLTISNVRQLLEGRGLNVRVNGASTSSAVASEQSVAAYSNVPAGTVITVEFTDYTTLED